MERLVPLTKILMTLAVSVWAILLRDWASLLALVVVELVVLFVAGYACHDTCIHLLVGNYKITRPYSSARNTMQNSLRICIYVHGSTTLCA